MFDVDAALRQVIIAEGSDLHLKVPAPPLATTGAGPVNAELTWAVALLTLGGLLAAAGTRRYRRTH